MDRSATHLNLLDDLPGVHDQRRLPQQHRAGGDALGDHEVAAQLRGLAHLQAATALDHTGNNIFTSPRAPHKTT